MTSALSPYSSDLCSCRKVGGAFWPIEAVLIAIEEHLSDFIESFKEGFLYILSRVNCICPHDLVIAALIDSIKTFRTQMANFLCVLAFMPWHPSYVLIFWINPFF